MSLLGFVGVSGAAAQGNIAEKTHQIAGVVVQGHRNSAQAAASVSIIDSVSIRESANASFAELLAKHSPIFVKTYGLGSMATVSFRGTGASHTQVEWNGMTINNPMLGQVDFSLLPVWFVDRVEVFHGGSSMLKGPGALGGSLVVGSSPSWDRKFYGNLVQGLGSYGLYQGFLSAGGGSRTIQGRVRYMYEKADNDFSYINTSLYDRPKMRQKDAGYDKHGVTGDVFLNAGKGHMLSLNLWYLDTDRNLPLLMSNAEKEGGESQKDKDLRVVAGWNLYKGKLSSKLTVGIQSLEVSYKQENKTNNLLISYSDSRALSYMNRYSLQYEFNRRLILSFNANFDYHDARIKDLKPVVTEIDDYSRTEVGAGVSLHYGIGEKITGYLLLREDKYDSDFSPLMPSVGFEYRPLKSEELSLKLNASRNYHRPTLNDLYWKPGGNADLKPEKGYTADLGVGYGKQRGKFDYSFSTSAYISRIKDWIIWTPVSGSMWQAENRKEVLSRGVEVFAGANFQSRAFKAGVSANYSYTRSTNEKTYSIYDNSKGKQLVYIPLHKGNVMFESEYKGWYLWWIWSVVSERFTTSSNESVVAGLPSYDIHDMTIGKKLEVSKMPVDIQFKVNNIFGRRYFALPDRPMPQQYFTVLAKISF